MAPTNKLLASLAAQCDDLIDEFLSLGHIDDVFWQVQAIIRSNDAINRDDVFQEWISTTYVDSLVVRLRRLGDADRRSVSVYRLLEEIKPEARTFTREWYQLTSAEVIREKADGWFDLIAGPGTEVLGQNRVKELQRTLKLALTRVARFANAHVTHRAKGVQQEPPRYEDARNCLCEALEVFNLCTLLVRKAPMNRAVSLALTDWLAVFRVPWLRDGQRVPPYTRLHARNAK